MKAELLIRERRVLEAGFMGTKEMPYMLISVEQLLDDFLADVAKWKGD
jgi:hypothetical protein